MKNLKTFVLNESFADHDTEWRLRFGDWAESVLMVFREGDKVPSGATFLKSDSTGYHFQVHLFAPRSLTTLGDVLKKRIDLLFGIDKEALLGFIGEHLTASDAESIETGKETILPEFGEAILEEANAVDGSFQLLPPFFTSEFEREWFLRHRRVSCTVTKTTNLTNDEIEYTFDWSIKDKGVC